MRSCGDTLSKQRLIHFSEQSAWAESRRTLRLGWTRMAVELTRQQLAEFKEVRRLFSNNCDSA